jgi:hypothetical protein
VGIYYYVEPILILITVLPPCVVIAVGPFAELLLFPVEGKIFRGLRPADLK